VYKLATSRDRGAKCIQMIQFIFSHAATSEKNRSLQAICSFLLHSLLFHFQFIHSLILSLVLVYIYPSETRFFTAAMSNFMIVTIFILFVFRRRTICWCFKHCRNSYRYLCWCDCSANWQLCFGLGASRKEV
jgi:hypothetical protein